MPTRRTRRRLRCLDPPVRRPGIDGDLEHEDDLHRLMQQPVDEG